MASVRQILDMMKSMGEDGAITFNNSKVAIIEFKKEYSVVPFITLSPNNMLNFPAYKHAVTKTGATIKLTSNWTGTMDYKITARI